MFACTFLRPPGECGPLGSAHDLHRKWPKVRRRVFLRMGCTLWCKVRSSTRHVLALGHAPQKRLQNHTVAALCLQACDKDAWALPTPTGIW